MKKIGEGYYYNVYRVDNGHVLKQIKNKVNIFLFIFFSNRFRLKNTLSEYKIVVTALPKLAALYKKIMNRVNNSELLGNPNFLHNGEYTQDLVSIKKDAGICSHDEFKTIIYDYVLLVKKLWEYGTADTVYNFSINSGYTSSGVFALIDFNEVTFEKEEVRKAIKEKVWLYRSSYERLPKEKQKFFKKVLEEELTENALDDVWCRRNMELSTLEK